MQIEKASVAGHPITVQRNKSNCTKQDHVCSGKDNLFQLQKDYSSSGMGENTIIHNNMYSVQRKYSEIFHTLP
jgi:hypothetical protein